MWVVRKVFKMEEKVYWLDCSFGSWSMKSIRLHIWKFTLRLCTDTQWDSFNTQPWGCDLPLSTYWVFFPVQIVLTPLLSVFSYFDAATLLQFILKPCFFWIIILLQGRCLALIEAASDVQEQGAVDDRDTFLHGVRDLLSIHSSNKLNDFH